MSDLRERLRAAGGKEKVRREKVTIPDVGDVWVRAMSLDEMDEYQRPAAEAAALARKAGKTPLPPRGMRARLVRYTVCNDDLSLCFTDDDLSWLGPLDGSVAEPLVDAALRVNPQLSREDVEGNSATGQTSNSA